jgi:methanogenic corrinoid protein MtbC1
LIGGGPVSKKYAEDIGADAYGNDAAQAVNLVRSLL